MTEINGQHYIDELKFNLETGDTIKISLVLAQFPNVDADTQRKAVFELMRADFEATAPAVARIVGLYPDLLDDAPSLGNAFSQNMIDCPSALLCALQNKEYKDKSAFIDMARALALEEATPALIRLLSSSPNQNEIHNCIIALGEIGGPSSVATISDFLYSRSKELSIAAIKALGAIASEEAIIKLTERIGSGYNEQHGVSLGLFDAVTEEVFETVFKNIAEVPVNCSCCRQGHVIHRIHEPCS